MKTGSILTILAAVAAVVIAAVVASGGGGGGSSGGKSASTAPSTSTAAPAGAQQLSFVVSPEKEALLKPLVAEFNASGDRRRQARLRAAEGDELGRRRGAIARGREQPDVWSPASSFWGRLLNLQADKPYVADENPSIVRTPLVIAMWEPMAQALGWPKKQVSFDHILKLATAPERLGGRGQAGVRALQVRPHQPGLLHLGRRGGDRLLLRVRGQEGGADRGRRGQGGPEGQGPRALDRALRRLDAVHRGPAVQGRPGLRLRGGDGGDDGHRLQPPPLLEHQARGALSAGGLVLQRLALHRPQRRLGDARGQPGRGRLPEVPGRRGQRRPGRPLRLPPGRPRGQAGRAS